MGTDIAARPRVFYGWVVVAAAFTLMAVDYAVVYSLGASFEVFIHDFGADRSAVALVFALTGSIYFGLGAVTGPLTDRFGPRRLCAVGGGALLVGLLLASQTRAVWQLYLSFSLLVGVGVAATYVPSVSTVQRWFVRHRGLASGLAGSGIGLGTLVGPLLARWLISTVGWRPSYALAGVAAAGLTWAAGWLLRREPRDLGLFPDGLAAPRSPGAGGRGGGGLSMGEVLRSGRFRWLYVTMAGVCVPIFLATGHIVPFARDAGLDEGGAVASLGAVGVGSTLGRLVLGPLLDRVGRERAYVASVAMVAGLMGVWLALPVGLGWTLMAWATAFGTAYGAFVALSPAVVADVFGARSVSGSIGVLYTGAGLGNLVGPWLGGVLFDRTGSYQPAIAGALVTALVAVWAVQAALAPGRRTQGRPGSPPRAPQPPGRAPAG